MFSQPGTPCHDCRTENSKAGGVFSRLDMPTQRCATDSAPGCNAAKSGGPSEAAAEDFLPRHAA